MDSVHWQNIYHIVEFYTLDGLFLEVVQVSEDRFHHERNDKLCHTSKYRISGTHRIEQF